MIETCVAPLFVPGDRIEMVAKAARSGADAIIVDLEDAVAPDRKLVARVALKSGLLHKVTVRINAISTDWFGADVEILHTENIVGIILPKTESAQDIALLRNHLIRPVPVVALVETALGVENVGEIARAADRLAFGPLDFAADMGCAPEAEALLYARSRLVLAARVARKPAPLDGVTANVRDPEACRADTDHAARLGFGGRLTIHPAQIPIVLAGFLPSEEEADWARRVMEAPDGATIVDGAMVDAPVRLRARQILARLRVN